MTILGGIHTQATIYALSAPSTQRRRKPALLLRELPSYDVYRRIFLSLHTGGTENSVDLGGNPPLHLVDCQDYFELHLGRTVLFSVYANGKIVLKDFDSSSSSLFLYRHHLLDWFEREDGFEVKPGDVYYFDNGKYRCEVLLEPEFLGELDCLVQAAAVLMFKPHKPTALGGYILEVKRSGNVCLNLLDYEPQRQNSTFLLRRAVRDLVDTRQVYLPRGRRRRHRFVQPMSYTEALATPIVKYLS